jgi:hypothetical protein
MEIDGNIIYDCLMKEILVQYHIDAFHKNIYTVVSKARRVYTDTAMEELLKSTSAAPVNSDRFMCRGDGERPGHQKLMHIPVMKSVRVALPVRIFLDLKAAQSEDRREMCCHVVHYDVFMM